METPNFLQMAARRPRRKRPASYPFPHLDIAYEVSFQDRGTDVYYTCHHEHESIKEAVACLYKSPMAPYHDRTIFAISEGEYRELTPSEEIRVAEASRSFIV